MATNIREEAVIQAAIGWWESLRPESYGEGHHLANPVINTQSSAQSAIASEVARLVLSRNVQAALPRRHPQRKRAKP